MNAAARRKRKLRVIEYSHDDQCHVCEDEHGELYHVDLMVDSEASGLTSDIEELCRSMVGKTYMVEDLYNPQSLIAEHVWLALGVREVGT